VFTGGFGARNDEVLDIATLDIESGDDSDGRQGPPARLDPKTIRTQGPLSGGSGHGS
jgi:hypothetical protein